MHFLFLPKYSIVHIPVKFKRSMCQLLAHEFYQLQIYHKRKFFAKITLFLQVGKLLREYFLFKVTVFGITVTFWGIC